MSIRIPAKSFFVGVDEDDLDEIDFDTLSNRFPCIDADTGMVEIANSTDAVEFIRFVMEHVSNIETLLGVTGRATWTRCAAIARKRNYERDSSANDYIKAQGDAMRSFASRISKMPHFSSTPEYKAHQDGIKALEDHYKPLVSDLDARINKAKQNAFPNWDERREATYTETRKFNAEVITPFLAALDENITGKEFLDAKAAFDDLTVQSKKLENAAYRAYKALEEERDIAVAASMATTLKAEQDNLRTEWRAKVTILDTNKAAAEKLYGAAKSAQALKTNTMIQRLASEIVGRTPADHETTENKLASLFLALMLDPSFAITDPEFLIGDEDWWADELGAA